MVEEPYLLSQFRYKNFYYYLDLIDMIKKYLKSTKEIIRNRLADAAFLSVMADILIKENVIRNELEKPLKSMICLRNLLAHQYGDMDFNR